MKSLLRLVVLIGVSPLITATQAAERDYQVPLPKATDNAAPFTPPPERDIPKDKFGDMVRLGRDIFLDTGRHAKSYVGNGLRCVNCHLDAGRLPNASPLWAAYTMYPAYRKKNDKVNTLEERIQGCFEYSMNGKAPPAGSQVLTALVTYHYWLAKGAPTGVELAGRGYPEVPKPQQTPDRARGKSVYAAQCALCHGDDGLGVKQDGAYVFPPLWGKDSYNWGAGMHRIDTAATFIKANMPLGLGGRLTDQEAWDVAAYINSHPRPKDPRQKKSIKEAYKTYHSDDDCYYGKTTDGNILGDPPS